MNGAKKVSCLGPAGSYSHLAAETLCPGSEVLLKNNFPAVFASLAEGEAEDAVIPIENSIRLFRALCRAGVSAEYHAFEKGEHGLSVCSEEVLRACTPESEHIRHWLQLSVEFLQAHGFFAA